MTTVKLWKYIRAAFSNRWNLLGLIGGVGFSFVSGHPEVGLPLVAAAECAWIGFVGTHPAFQRHVEMREHAEAQDEESRSADVRMRRMLTSLPRGAQQRFHSLMKQCEELRTITDQYHAAQNSQDDEEILTDVRIEGLDRLLWLFLKLLYTEHSLNRFFETTTIDDIVREIDRLRKRLDHEQQRPGNEQRERIIATLQDNLKTCELRRRNFEQARDSYELVKAEQKRLENKIRSIAEMGISRGDPAVLSGQVDSVAGSIQEAEKTLNDLQFVTGFSAADEAVPSFVQRNLVTQ